jgi:DNA repair photolyase
MPLTKSFGNMYDWVTHVHTHLGGECSHKCKYCYVKKSRFGVPPRYQGKPRLIEKELTVNYGTGKTIFIEHKNDLFADGIEQEWIDKILRHCSQYPDNRYIFQTKNPRRAWNYHGLFPEKMMFGTTIESDLDYPEISNARKPYSRYEGIKQMKELGYYTFITVEPIMKFTPVLAQMIIYANPNFVNIGADSKKSGLPEPSEEEILEFINILNKNHIKILRKTNLERLLK